jgi:hypothetical protein
MIAVFKRPWILLAGLCAAVGLTLALSGCKPEELGSGHPTTDEFYDPVLDFAAEPRLPVAPKSQSDEDVAKKSVGCMTCHKGIENPSMHDSAAVKLGCTDCHGGTGTATEKEVAHVHPRGHWYSQKPTFTKKWEVNEPKKEGAEAKPETEKKESSSAKSKENPISVTSQTNDAAATFMIADDTKPAPEAKPAPDVKPVEVKKDVVVEEHLVNETVTDRTQENDEHGSEHFETAGNPKRSNIAWLQESPEFVRFVNPGDLRVARYSCGECHSDEVHNVPRSMMAHGAMLRGAALYNNGAHNQKIARYGEAYTLSGQPARLQQVPAPTPDQIKLRGILPWLDPLPRYNVTQSGNILRAFERGGHISKQVAETDKEDEPGKPEFKNSVRGFGTKLSTDPVFLGIQKTRLFDPILWNLGTNDQSGDYRSSGCTACHVIYANDRDPAHSGQYAKYGKHGHSFSEDATMKDIVGRETGHPIKHKLTSAIPSSQCVVCHMHPGTTVTNTYYGTLWWDNETEGSKLYPATQEKKTERTAYKIKIRNPEGAALRGLWGDVDFLESVFDHNSDFKQVQFADFNGHGWLFRNIYKQDLHGNLLDKDDKIVPFDSPNKFKKGPNGEPIAGSVVHMQDIHQEKGMHCIDCHFSIDNHGNGNLYGEVRNATEIMCADCHGTIYKKALLKTSGNSAPNGGTDLSKTTTSFGKRFKWEGDKLYQQSATNKDLKWEVIQTVDTITPGSPHYNEQSRYAKTMRRDAQTWGDVPTDPKLLAHQDEKMDCYVCHTGFMASCFGCHLPMRANQARFNNHYEGAKSKNWTQYNFQTLRDDCFMLGIDGTVKHNKVAPVRSMCAVIVSSQNAQREWIYSQQQTVSAEGFSGQAFAPHYPHNVRSKETKKCSECHVSKAGDNNARLAQTYLLGTNQTNFMFRYVYTANEDGGFNAVTVTEHDEPQAVIGSTLHRDAYPEEYEEHCKKGRELQEVDHHDGTVLNTQLRGEYLYAARGKGGLTVYDVAAIDNKGFSEKMVTAPVSPLGQRLYVKSSYCTSVISPTVLGVDPTRQPPLRPRDPMNQEQGISLTYAFLYCTDRDEGLFTVMAGTLLDGDPTNNFMRRHMTFNPGGILCGAVNGVVAGNYLYICADAGLVIIDISKIGTELAETATQLNPDGSKVISVDDLVKHAPAANPDLLKVVGVIPMNRPKAVRIQFRYAFVVDADGLKVVDITEPTAAKLVPKAFVPFKDARNVYLSRIYAYIAAGSEGMAIVDIEKAEEPKIDQMYTANGLLSDVNDIKVGMTNASVFAYVANGCNGLAVVQMTSPENVPTYLGWASKVKPELIATKKLSGNTLAISEGLQRDRGVDESGNQLSVFNRVGSRPFNHTEMEAMYKIDGKLFTVSNSPVGTPLEIKPPPGTIDPKLKAKIEELEDALKKERNPAKKKKIQEELDAAKKEAEAQASAGGNEDKVKDLEEQIAKERNPAKKKKLQAELEELKKKK